MNTTIKNIFARFHADESGATATEYVILLVLVAFWIRAFFPRAPRVAP